MRRDDSGRRHRPHVALPDPTFWTATATAGAVAVLELLAIAWIQWRYMDTPPVAAAAKVMLGGAVVLAVGILIGNS
jgi:hypothetical protein